MKSYVIFAICFFLVGCSGLQLNIPVEVSPVKRENVALLVMVENKSTYQIKITHPISTGMLKQDQHTIFRLLQPGNYKVIITAHASDPHYPNVYQLVKTVEIPVFLNGYDVVKVKDTFVGYYLVVTDGMLFPER
ncbi:MAG: hypothetical protein L6308_03730 [Candidatus Omnitrophica bacterium]|nr:hypothetical protein [Pseudomonadota bacterium]MCG2713936.1 hypothetical protein [Candidatus Omnitrophota bacterium]